MAIKNILLESTPAMQTDIQEAEVIDTLSYFYVKHFAKRQTFCLKHQSLPILAFTKVKCMTSCMPKSTVLTST